ncbi:MAG: decarboxylating 6-phosphogluconate dehydrogenase [Elusimicrobiales bacterium]|nr:decarboxylating 6-phosphogluconate dehydrogenase [Elusimicrobiales bacterium]
MKIAMVGLGRMGLNMTRRLLRAGHQVVGYNRSEAPRSAAAGAGAIIAEGLRDLVSGLETPRAVWLMLPAGAPTEDTVRELSGLLSPGDTIIDGGNTFYKDDVRRSAELDAKGINYLDAGVSGGIWGLENGYCLMVGGPEAEFKRLEPVLAALAPKEGYLHTGAAGSGHFVKMAHNGIEYAMMQAYGEGFEIIQASPYKQDLGKLSHLWNRGSVVRSWLLELAEEAFKKDPDLEAVSGYVEDSGEGRWTAQQAVESGVAAPVITLSLYGRFLSRQKDAFQNRVLAALRNQFGGHAVAAAGENKRSASAGAGGWRPSTPQDEGKK